jgi:ABC-type sugar transport system substrate-binding protein
MNGDRKAIRMGWVVALTVMVALAFSGGAVTAQASDEVACPEAPAEPIEVGAMLWNTGVAFYSNFIKGQEDAAACFGVELDLQNGNGDLATEVALIQQFIAQGKDAIIVTPSDVEGIVPVVLEANAAGIPVFAANNRIGEDADVVSFIGANDVEFGRRQGEMLVAAVGEEAKVGLILGALGTSAQLLREQGMTEYLADYPGVEIIEKQTANWADAEALALTQDWLSKYGEGEIDAIVGQGPEVVAGAQWAAQNNRSDVQFLAGDYPYNVKVAIEDGVVAGTVDQDPYPQGYEAVQYAYYWLTDQQDKVERPDHFLPLPIVTAENVDEYEAAWGTPE